MTSPARLLDDPKIERVLGALKAAGAETRIVGGAVRDALMGMSPREIDLSTTALPEETMAAARGAGLKCVPTGLEHGTVTIVVEGAPFEVTTLREDVETFGRRARVRFGRDFEKDALRRDFTINALSLSADGTLHDYAGGLADLARRRIRFIGDPARRIAEDHLRILRFFRFHAAYGEGQLDAAGLHAAILARSSLAKLSAERLRAEMLRLLEAKRAAEVARVMAHAGILEVVAGAVYPARLERLAAIEAANGDPVLRLAALAVLVAEDADRLRDRLRLSNAEHARLHFAARLLESLHGAEAPPGEKELRRLLFLHGGPFARDALALAHAESRERCDDPRWLAAARFLREQAAPKFPLKAAALLARGVPRGEALGAALKAAQEKWIAAGFPDDPAAIARLADMAASSASVRED